ncbi:hypothetical protein MNBD_NITROSPINAE01-1501, partial [hydrothermal vent metagenome]
MNFAKFSSLLMLLIVFIMAPNAMSAEDHGEMDHSKHKMPVSEGAGQSAGEHAKNEKIDIGRMKLTLMPEYDGAGLIVIKEGKFADKSKFPREVTFNIPKGVKKITDVCSLSPGGQHFCQLFDITEGQGTNILNAKLPYSDFFIDFKYSPFEIEENSTRTFTYDLSSQY